MTNMDLNWTYKGDNFKKYHTFGHFLDSFLNVINKFYSFLTFLEENFQFFKINEQTYK